MKVIEKYGIGEAPNSLGHVVIIDVLRAFTTAAFAFSRGAEEIFLVSEADEAFSIKRKNPSFLLVGEIDGRKIEGFDFGNSPDEVSKTDLTGKRIVLRSSSGTQGVVNSRKADNIFLGSLVVASSTAKYLCEQSPENVTLLAMGAPNGSDGDEDIACSNYMASLFTGSKLDLNKVSERVDCSLAGQQATDPGIDWITPQDLYCATSIDKFRFAMPVFREAGNLIARKIEVQ